MKINFLSLLILISSIFSKDFILDEKKSNSSVIKHDSNIIDKIISETFSQNPKHMTVNILYSLFGETKKKLHQIQNLKMLC